MAEPLKNLFDAALIRMMAGHLARASADFDVKAFEARALDGLERLEFKARSAQIADALEDTLPADFVEACNILRAALHPEALAEGWTGDVGEAGIRGWAILPMGEYVARRGLQHFDLSLDILRDFTSRLTSEFAVRPFLNMDLARAMDHVRRWAKDSDPHVRRLASEGTRPRLPWGMQLKALITDPAPILPVLEALRDDPSEYVRRSVANSLNDIAKDHPDLVAELAAGWMKDAGTDRQRLLKHACRTLLKNGHPGALSVFGYGPVKLSRAILSVEPGEARIGDTLEMTLTLETDATARQALLVDYVMFYMKARGQHGPKVFKWTETEITAQTALILRKAHKLRDVTTRQHYSGRHKVEAQVNGVTVAEDWFELSLGA